MKLPMRQALQGASRRSSMYLWMAENRAEFGQVLRELSPPDWKKVAEFLVAEGLTDAKGSAPTDKTAYQTWWKVRKEFASGKTALPAARPTQRAEPVSEGPDPSADAATRRLAALNNEHKNRSK